jgi:hypothetical protein
VEAVLNRQREPEGLRFWVICSPGARQFELYYDSITDAWDVQPWGAVPLNDNS